MQPIDLHRVHTISLKSRQNKSGIRHFAGLPEKGKTFSEFMHSLPTILAGEDFLQVVNAIVRSHRDKRQVIVGIGAHVIKCGLAPILIDLMRRGVITCIAMNGAGAIHDFEVAMIGETSEDVAAGLANGTFGMVRETGEWMNSAIQQIYKNSDRGMGFLLGEKLVSEDTPYKDLSLLAFGFASNVPVTVHVAIGTDIIHMHPSADGAAIGQASFSDFKLFSAAVAQLSGGVYLNVGSAVIMPEVFLKALTIAQNIGSDLQDFTTVNMDMMMHYRPSENVVRRPSGLGGRGYTLIGRHEIMVPLLAQAIVDAL